jgi:chemotaxis protein MotB
VASKKQIIVIKKIYVNGGGHHGGSWKVALADFMTALMAFFLVMWLLGQNEETKKAISDYFSTPSMIEYNYENYGAEVTIEKLFLDFVNEPTKAIQSFFEPADKTPNIMDLGSSKVVAAFMADKLTDVAKNVTISQDGIDFDIPDTYLFERGTDKPKAEFISVIEKVTSITSGLKDSEVKLVSALFIQAIANQNQLTAEKVAQARLDFVKNKIAATFEHTSNKIIGSINVKDKKGEFDLEKLVGFIRVSIKAKEGSTVDPKKRAALEKTNATTPNTELNKPVFESFAKEAIADGDREEKAKINYKRYLENLNRHNGERTAEGVDPNLANPVEMELNKLNEEAEPISK